MTELALLTHHKCATNWLLSYAEDICKSNDLKMFQTYLSNLSAPPGHDIHVFTNASFEFLSPQIGRAVHVIRNPMDIVVSAYHSHKVTHSLSGWPALYLQRQLLLSENEHDGQHLTLAFLERDDFFAGAVGPLHALRHWNFSDDRFVTLRMEDLVLSPGDLLGPSVRAVFPDVIMPTDVDHSFEALTGRRPGQLDTASHYRSGLANQWQEALAPSIIRYIRAHYAPLLEAFYPEALA